LNVRAVVANLPTALASVLSALERDGLRYVLYRDPRSDHRVVILVEGPDDLAILERALRNAGAESSENEADDFVLRSSDVQSQAGPTYVVKAQAGSGKTAIANLLWLAATNEGAAAARHSVNRTL
jgi:hypothetical protein